MGVGCKLSMIRWGLPSVHSALTTNSSPPCCCPSIKGKEFDFGLARLTLLPASFDESETLRRDSLRPHACSSSSPQLVDSDYSTLEMMISKRSHTDVHNVINGSQVPPDKDISVFIQSLQACSGSHFHLLMENINVLENKIIDLDKVKLEEDILVQLRRLGALELFHACLSRTVRHPAFDYIANFPAEPSEDSRAKGRKDIHSAGNFVGSKRKQERKIRNQRRLKIAGKFPSESSVEDSTQPSVSSVTKKTRRMGKRVMIAKNEAEMSKGIKVVAKLESVKAKLERETGRMVNLSSWAEAVGIDEKALQNDLHFGWYCRDELLKSGRSLVVYLARNYRGLGVAYEDLLQAGNIGILQGAERFDHTRGYQFSTYVQYWIRKAMSQLVSRHGRGIKVPLTLSTAISRVQRARKTLKRTLGKRPDDVELAKFTGLSLDKIKSADRCLRIVGSIDQKVGNCIEVKFLECNPDTSIELPEKSVMKHHMRYDINKLLNELDPKERRVLLLRYGFEGHCMSLYEIGKIFNVSKEWIRRMEKRAITKLKDEETRRSLRHYTEL